MKKIINQELSMMKYLTGYKRGVVISEQEAPTTDVLGKAESFKQTIREMIDYEDNPQVRLFVPEEMEGTIMELGERPTPGTVIETFNDIFQGDASELVGFDENLFLFIDEDVPGGATSFMFSEVMDKQGGYRWLDAAPKILCAQSHRPAYGSDGDYFSKPNIEDIINKVEEIMAE